MQKVDRRSEHLGWIETALRAGNPDLPNLALFGLAHYGPSHCLAFVVVSGVARDQVRRRQLRTEANDLLRRLGYAVEIEPGRDVYDLVPIRPASSHERLRMLRDLLAACDPGS
ncbi:hypothetical protein SAMN05444413_11250 [Roseivivax marinus]|nr:hypothetical protein [Roseivivax marinus]SEL62978.1 hypothetical protein SAMN05444413_11250 [Roseivivax marinus]